MSVEDLIKFLGITKDENGNFPSLYGAIDYGKHENFELTWGINAVKVMLPNKHGQLKWNGQWKNAQVKQKNIRLPKMADYEALFEYISIYGGALAAESPFGSWRHEQEHEKFLVWSEDYKVEWRCFNPKQTNSHRHDVKEAKPDKKLKKEESDFLFTMVFVKGVSTGRFRRKRADANGVFHAKGFIPQIIQKRVNMQIEEVVDNNEYRGLNDALPLGGIRATLDKLLIPVTPKTTPRKLVDDAALIHPWFKEVCEKEAGIHDKFHQALLYNAIVQSSCAERAAVTAIYCLDLSTEPLIEANEKGDTVAIGRKSFFDALVQLFGNRHGNKVSSEYNMRLGPQLAKLIIKYSDIFNESHKYKGLVNDKTGKGKASCIHPSLRKVALKLARTVVENHVFNAVYHARKVVPVVIEGMAP
jgi:hypothetical protein